MSQNAAKKKILVDADVIRHLFSADKLSLLSELFNGRTYVVDYVAEELRSIAPLQMKIIVGLGILQEMKFPTNDIKILGEYSSLIKKQFKGRGESACMAISRFSNDIIASNNTRDIVDYCQKHSIQYLTTLDIFSIAYLTKKMDLSDVDHCIYKIKAKSGLSKFDRIEDYIKYEFDENKLDY
jgi:hypothetical protein